MSENRAQRILPGEADYISRAKDGDKDAYRVLVEGYQDRLFGLVISLVPHREQAEDLMQEIFIKAYFALQSFEGGSAFYTWMYRIASNHCLDHLRKRRPEQVSIDQPLKDDSTITFENTLEAPLSERPETRLDAPTEAVALLGTLKPDERVILTLRELEGHSYEDLAEVLNCPINTVKSRLNRAREALKQAYFQIYGNISDSKIVLDNREKP